MRLIKHIKASNLLSFGPDGLDLELHDLNVLIGPNGSGKSNFLEIFELLRSLPRSQEDSNNLNQILNTGGRDQWFWKGNKQLNNLTIETLLEIPVPYFVSYDMAHSFSINPLVIGIYAEQIIHFPITGSEEILYIKKEGKVDAKIKTESNNLKHVSNLLEDKYWPMSILSSQFHHFGIGDLAGTYEKIRLYREWSFGRNTIFRTPQRSDLRNDRLEADFSNLGMFLSRLRKDPATKKALIHALRDLYEGLTDFEIITEGGFVQIFFTEGDYSIPAIRLSDGTLRYLCMLAILLDPTPPPLICIEEPELGLHPDILPKIADLLVDASKRTQLIVTTHSDVLIDALSDTPESVLVCEKHDGQTQIKRLERSAISHWLEDYRLGQLWTRGEIGGTRW